MKETKKKKENKSNNNELRYVKNKFHFHLFPQDIGLYFLSPEKLDSLFIYKDTGERRICF